MHIGCHSCRITQGQAFGLRLDRDEATKLHLEAFRVASPRPICLKAGPTQHRNEKTRGSKTFAAQVAPGVCAPDETKLLLSFGILLACEVHQAAEQERWAGGELLLSFGILLACAVHQAAATPFRKLHFE